MEKPKQKHLLNSRKTVKSARGSRKGNRGSTQYSRRINRKNYNVSTNQTGHKPVHRPRKNQPSKTEEQEIDPFNVEDEVFVEYVKTQYGSRRIQKRLSYSNPEERILIFKKLEAYFPDLMKHEYGNYLVQKFFEIGTKDQIAKLISFFDTKKAKIHLLAINKFGGRVLQKAIDTLRFDDEFINTFVEGIFVSLIETAKNINGSHVIQVMYEKIGAFKAKKLEKITTKLIEEVELLSVDVNGSRAVEKMMEKCNSDQLDIVYKVLIENFVELMEDQFGSFVVQKLIELVEKGKLINIVKIAEGLVKTEGTHVYGHRIIESLLENTEPCNKEKLESEICNHLLLLSKSRYGSFTVRKCIETMSPEGHFQMIECMKNFIVDLALDYNGSLVLRHLLEHVDKIKCKNVYEVFHAVFANLTSLEKSQCGGQVIEKCLNSATTNIWEMVIKRFGDKIVYFFRTFSGVKLLDQMIQILCHECKNKKKRESSKFVEIKKDFDEECIEENEKSCVKLIVLLFRNIVLIDSFLDKMENPPILTDESQEVVAEYKDKINILEKCLVCINKYNSFEIFRLLFSEENDKRIVSVSVEEFCDFGNGGKCIMKIIDFMFPEKGFIDLERKERVEARKFLHSRICKNLNIYISKPSTFLILKKMMSVFNVSEMEELIKKIGGLKNEEFLMFVNKRNGENGNSGWCILEKCLKSISPDKYGPIIESVQNNIVELCNSGAHLIDFLLDHTKKSLKIGELEKHLFRNVTSLLRNKVGAQCVERCINRIKNTMSKETFLGFCNNLFMEDESLIVKLCITKYGCEVVGNILEIINSCKTKNSKVESVVHNQIEDNFCKLLQMDKNFIYELLEKHLDTTTTEKVTKLIESILNQESLLIELSCKPSGNLVVQKLLEISNKNDKKELISKLCENRSKLEMVISNENGFHVIEKCLDIIYFRINTLRNNSRGGSKDGSFFESGEGSFSVKIPNESEILARFYNNRPSIPVPVYSSDEDSDIEENIEKPKCEEKDDQLVNFCGRKICEVFYDKIDFLGCQKHSSMILIKLLVIPSAHIPSGGRRSSFFDTLEDSEGEVSDDDYHPDEPENNQFLGVEKENKKEKEETEGIAKLFDGIFNNMQMLSKNQYGSFVVEKIIDKFKNGQLNKKMKENFLKSFVGKLTSIAMDKYGSYIIKKIIKLDYLRFREEILKNLTKIISVKHGYEVIDSLIRRNGNLVYKHRKYFIDYLMEENCFLDIIKTNSFYGNKIYESLIFKEENSGNGKEYNGETKKKKKKEKPEYHHRSSGSGEEREEDKIPTEKDMLGSLLDDEDYYYDEQFLLEVDDLDQENRRKSVVSIGEGDPLYSDESIRERFLQILRMIIKHGKSVSSTSSGESLFEKVILGCNEIEDFEILLSISDDVKELTKTSLASKAVQKIVARLDKFLVELVEKDCSEEFFNSVKNFFMVLVEDFDFYCNHPYGNYIMQQLIHSNKFIIKYCGKNSDLTELIKTKVVQFSFNKHACNFVEKMYLNGNNEKKESMVMEVLDDKNNSFLKMSNHKYATFVIQKMIEFGGSEIQKTLLKELKKNEKFIKKNHWKYIQRLLKKIKI